MASHKRTHRGFTLIEAIITVAIIGILAAVAWPMYDAQSKKSIRTEAVAALSQAKLLMERCRSNSANGTYAGCNLATAKINNTSKNGKYTIAEPAIAGNSFTLTATRVGTDKDCKTLTLTNLGIQNHTGDAPSAQRCWGAK